MKNNLLSSKKNSSYTSKSPSSSATTASKHSSRPLIWTVYGLTLAFLLFTLLVNKVTGYSIAVMVRDPVYVLDGHPIIGMQSNIGVLAWFAGASIGLFCAALLHNNAKTHPAAENPTRQHHEAASFLWRFGLITLWLALDDLFLIHEYLSEGVLGISELPIYLVYAIVVAWQVVRFRKYILRSQALPLLLGAIAFFALSILSDLLLTGWDQFGRIFFEDGFKLLGIVSWSSYLIQKGFSALRLRYER